MRILWLSAAPWASSGYGVQTALFVPRLVQSGQEIAVCALGLAYGMLKWNDIVCYPTGSHPYGSDVIAAHGRNWSADICITLHDAWVFEPSSFAGTIPWVPWFPVDHDPLPPPVLDKMRSALSPVVFSHFAERMCKEAGLSPLYVPHGVDTESFRPRDRQEARASLDLPMDRFIVGMVAANHGYPSRKSLPQALEAFARFRARHTDALLYLHTFRGDEPWAPPGVNLPPLVDHLGITDSVLVANSYDNFVGLSDDYLARVYSACDCLLCPSMGEGFGVPILEAQACACPVIVGDWTSMSELCFAGYKIPRGSSEPFWTGLNSYQWLPHVDSIVEGLEHMYEHRNDEQLRRAAQDGALPYDADHVTERYWKPALDEIRGRLGESGRRGGRRPRALTGRDVPVHEFFIHADSGQFYEDLHTECTPWLDLCVLLQLIRRYRPSSFLEVGTHKGHVTRAVADRFPEMHIVTVDPGDKVPPQERHPSQIHEYLPQDQIGILVADHPNVRVVREQFEEVDWTDSFDMVFLDGNHSFESVLRDSRIALEISSRPGIIVWHDFNNMLDVNRAIEALGLSKDIVSVRDTWIAFHSTHEESVS